MCETCNNTGHIVFEVGGKMASIPCMDCCHDERRDVEPSEPELYDDMIDSYLECDGGKEEE